LYNTTLKTYLKSQVVASRNIMTTNNMRKLLLLYHLMSQQ